jgi:hypothetical protein
MVLNYSISFHKHFSDFCECEISFLYTFGIHCCKKGFSLHEIRSNSNFFLSFFAVAAAQEPDLPGHHGGRQSERGLSPASSRPDDTAPRPPHRLPPVSLRRWLRVIAPAAPLLRRRLCAAAAGQPLPQRRRVSRSVWRLPRRRVSAGQ